MDQLLFNTPSSSEEIKRIFISFKEKNESKSKNSPNSSFKKKINTCSPSWTTKTISAKQPKPQSKPFFSSSLQPLKAPKKSRLSWKLFAGSWKIAGRGRLHRRWGRFEKRWVRRWESSWKCRGWLTDWWRGRFWWRRRIEGCLETWLDHFIRRCIQRRRIGCGRCTRGAGKGVTCRWHHNADLWVRWVSARGRWDTRYFTVILSFSVSWTTSTAGRWRRSRR